MSDLLLANKFEYLSVGQIAIEAYANRVGMARDFAVSQRTLAA